MPIANAVSRGLQSCQADVREYWGSRAETLQYMSN